jgi:hypothetical protein
MRSDHLRMLAGLVLLAFLGAAGCAPAKTAAPSPPDVASITASTTVVSLSAAGATEQLAVLELEAAGPPDIPTTQLALQTAPGGGVYDHVYDWLPGKLLLDDTGGGNTIVDSHTGEAIASIPGPQKPGWFMGNIDFSERWAVWWEAPEETEEEWALYYLDLGDMKPHLLSSAVAADVQFPLFSLVGDKVVWFENHHQGFNILSTTLFCRDLASGTTCWQIAGSTHEFGMPQIVKDKVWWIETNDSRKGANLLYRSAALSDGQESPAVELKNADWINYYPAAAENGALAWIVRGSDMPDLGTVYVQLPDGRRFRLSGTSRMVCFVGNLLARDSYVVDGDVGKEMITVTDLAEQTQWTVESAAIEGGGGAWRMANTRSRPDHTLVLERAFDAQNGELAGLEMKLIDLSRAQPGSSRTGK